MNTTIAALAWTGIAFTPWKLIGLAGALLFGARWLVQFGASRRAGRAVSDKQDAVGVLQNLLPALTAAYSLRLELWPREPATGHADANSGTWSGPSSGSRNPDRPTPAKR